jgi:Na+/proline symporter
MLSIYDYLVIAFYFVFMFSVGVVTRKLASSTSDYFRGGGKMLWWIAGASAFMSQFSAWTFIGAAGEAYLNGPIVITIFAANAVGFFFNYAYFAPKFRQMRVVTSVQAVKQRFGRSGEQTFTWMQVPTNLLTSGIWLNALGIFAATVFGFNLQYTIIGVGLIVLVNAFLGGAWAVAFGDFLQALILILISVVTALYALGMVEIGGIQGLIDKFPAESILGSNYNYAAVLISWIVLMFFNQFFKTNHMIDAHRYLCAKDSASAKKAAMLSTILFTVGPLFWFIPPMACAVIYPDLGAQFPQLTRPHEAAYVAVAMKVLPAGMLGLLLAGMFSATVSSMDSGLNRNAGILVKNFYVSLIRKNCSDREQMIVAKSLTVGLGLFIIAEAIFYSQLKNLGLFDLMINVGAMFGIPLAVPLLWGVLIRKTPDWSGWSTALLGVLCSYVIKIHFNAAWVSETWMLDFTARELRYFDQALIVLVNVTVPSLYFLSTTFFYKELEGERKVESDLLWANLAKPVIADEDGAPSLDSKQGILMGGLAGAYGLFLFALSLVPNEMSGRISYLICGSVLMILAYAIFKSTRPKSTN